MKHYIWGGALLVLALLILGVAVTNVSTGPDKPKQAARAPQPTAPRRTEAPSTATSVSVPNIGGPNSGANSRQTPGMPAVTPAQPATSTGLGLPPAGTSLAPGLPRPDTSVIPTPIVPPVVSDPTTSGGVVNTHSVSH
jgi:hypothetical protein